MGTLGCINDMMRRDKENRELRNRNRERINDTRNRLIEVGKKRELPDMSAGSIDHIRKNTVEKERADNDKLFRLKLKFAVIVGVALLLCYVAYVFIIKQAAPVKRSAACLRLILLFMDDFLFNNPFLYTFNSVIEIDSYLYEFSSVRGKR